MKEHAGTSIFLNIMEGTYLLYEGKRLFDFSGIYSDQYGMTLKDFGHRGCDMSTIELNREKSSQLASMILKHNLAEKITQTGVLKNKVYSNGFY